MAIPAAPRRASGGRALAALGGLRDGLEPGEAADLVWVHNDPALYHRLVIERRWAKKHSRSGCTRRSDSSFARKNYRRCGQAPVSSRARRSASMDPGGGLDEYTSS